MMEVVSSANVTKRYSVYKDSGVSWLGEVPKHWVLLRGNYVFKVINERSSKGNETLLSVSEHHGVKLRSESNVNMFLAESYEGYKLCSPGDLVINSLWAWSRGLGVSKYRGIVSTAYSVYRADQDTYDERYLNYLLRIENYVAQYLIASKGIWISRLLLSDWSFLRLPILSPPRHEQSAIAKFLDRKTAQIDQAIAQKEKLIELLKERRQISIHNAVTRGLNPNVPMKESGIEWIGEIPEHWKICALVYVAKVDTGSTPDRTKPNFWNGAIPWVKTGEVNYSVILRTEEYITDTGLKYSATKVAPAGTILMAMYGQGVTRGRVAILGTAAAYNQACCAIRFTNQIDNVYGYHFFFAAYPHVRDAGNETTQYTMGWKPIGCWIG